MTNKISGGLIDTPIDARDLPLGAAIGSANVGSLPTEYTTSEPLKIKNQGNTDMCTAYALTAVSEDQEGILLDPFYTFARTKELMGSPESWGADLRSACKSAQKFGFIEASKDLTIPPTTEDRDRASLGIGFSKADDQRAFRHKKQSYFTVDGSNDVFDNFRSALWQMRDEERSIFTGCLWRESWTDAPQGVIDNSGSGGSFGHAIKIYGWDHDFLVAQLSNGSGIGRLGAHAGTFLIHRDVVNASFKYGAFTFLDMPREEAEFVVKRAAEKNPFGIMRLWLAYWYKTILA